MSQERVVVPVEPEAAALRSRFDADYKDALRSRNETAVGTLRLLRAGIQELLVGRTDAKRKDFGQPLTAADLVGLIEKQIKQREEAAEAFEKGARPDRAAKERAEAALLRQYLPEKLGRPQIEAVVNRLVKELGRDFRKVMPAAAKELKGKADGRLVQEVVREITESH